MKNARQLRDELSAVFEKLKNGLITYHEAGELANIGGKMVASAKVQIEYYALRQEKPEIEWLKE